MNNVTTSVRCFFSEMTPFIRPNDGLHVKVIRLPPAYGNVLAFYLIQEHFYSKKKKSLWIQF